MWTFLSVSAVKTVVVICRHNVKYCMSHHLHPLLEHQLHNNCPNQAVGPFHGHLHLPHLVIAVGGLTLVLVPVVFALTASHPCKTNLRLTRVLHQGRHLVLHLCLETVYSKKQDWMDCMD